MMRVAIPWLLLALALAVLGGVGYAATDGTAEALSVGVIGLAAVVAVSALFYAVGRSEDAEEERDSRR